MSEKSKKLRELIRSGYLIPLRRPGYDLIPDPMCPWENAIRDIYQIEREEESKMEPKVYYEHTAWTQAATKQGYEGPFEHWGNPPGELFNYPSGGTAAIWNANAGRGTVFE